MGIIPIATEVHQSAKLVHLCLCELDQILEFAQSPATQCSYFKKPV